MLGCIYGKFDANSNIINGTFQQLSIEAPVKSIVVINDKEFYIGSTGILEFNEQIDIDNLVFKTPVKALITYDK